MNLIGLMLARNEEWILNVSVRAALLWCDRLVVLDHGSTDSTPAILDAIEKEHPGRFVRLHRSADAKWNEMDHRQATLDVGRAAGGTHFALIDADEVLSGHLLPHARKWTENLPAGRALELPMVPCWRSFDKYRCDDVEQTRAIWSLAFADATGLAWSAPDGYHHHHRLPYGCVPHDHPFPAGYLGMGGVMHLQFSVWERIIAKHAWYKMLERVCYPGHKTVAKLDAMYSQTVNEDGLQLADCPAEWWAPYMAWRKDLPPAFPSWHVAECQRMLAEHGPELFSGLDLFGVVPAGTTTKARPCGRRYSGVNVSGHVCGRNEGHAGVCSCSTCGASPAPDSWAWPGHVCKGAP